MDTVDNWGVAICTCLENLDDLGVNQDIEVTAEERRLNIISSRVRARTILDLVSW